MSILIKNASILDGSGSASYKGDIYIRNDKIFAIGNLGRQGADEIIQAAGLYASPGFIDCNTNSDHYLTLFTNLEQQDFITQGVTTILGGMCGSSLAPLLYGDLISIRKWADTRKVNVGWHKVAEFLEILKKIKLGVNFGTFAGHSTIRRALLGEDFRELTTKELGVFKKILSDSLRDGAFGMSAGLGYVHGRHTSYAELGQLLKLVYSSGGLYAAHLRNEAERLNGAVAEVLKLAKETGVRAVINHMQPLKGFEAEYENALEQISESAGEADVYFDVYPFEMSQVPIYSLLPLWAQTGNLETMLASLKDENVRKKIIKDTKILNIGDIRIATDPNNNYLPGKTLAEFAQNRNLDEVSALIKLMEATKLRATVFYKNTDFPLTIKALSHARVLIASNMASFPANSFVSERKETFVKFISLALNKNLLTIEEAVKKITSVPAQKFGIKNRGILKDGYAADITLFSADQSGVTSVKSVIINGSLALKDGVLQTGRFGSILRAYS